MPPIALALAKHPIVEQYDLSSLKHLICGAAPLSPELESKPVGFFQWASPPKSNLPFNSDPSQAPSWKNEGLPGLRYVLGSKHPENANAYRFLGTGMTETTAVCLLPVNDSPVNGSCGKLVANMEARLIDEEGRDVAAGQVGELWVRGPVSALVDDFEFSFLLMEVVWRRIS